MLLSARCSQYELQHETWNSCSQTASRLPEKGVLLLDEILLNSLVLRRNGPNIGRVKKMSGSLDVWNSNWVALMSSLPDCSKDDFG